MRPIRTIRYITISRVSIHAPARGATIGGGCGSVAGQVSIHAPARGATSRTYLISWLFVFQSTHPQGVRRSARISASSGMSFNPRTRKGCDIRTAHPKGQGPRFQSTHPQGVRPPKRPNRAKPPCFNPRTRKGCDPAPATVSLRLTTFQSTHPQGVRHDGKEVWIRHVKFQSTHPQGVRREDLSQSRAAQSFNPRTRKGCDI